MVECSYWNLYSPVRCPQQSSNSGKVQSGWSAAGKRWRGQFRKTVEHLRLQVPENTSNGHTDRVYSVDFSPSGNLLASCSEDGTIRVWRVQTGECTKEMRCRRLYEGMNITGATGLTDIQKMNLKLLGAIDDMEKSQGLTMR